MTNVGSTSGGGQHFSEFQFWDLYIDPDSWEFHLDIFRFLKVTFNVI